MKVYVVVSGELSQGGDVVGVFRFSQAGLERATACALAERAYGGPWAASAPGETHVVRRWTSGVDFVQIEEHGVQ